MLLKEVIDFIGENWPEQGEPPSANLMQFIESQISEHKMEGQLWRLRGCLIDLDLHWNLRSNYVRQDQLNSLLTALMLDKKSWETYEELGYFFDTYSDLLFLAELAFNEALSLGAGIDSKLGLARVLAESNRKSDAIAFLKQPDFGNEPKILAALDEIENNY